MENPRNDGRKSVKIDWRDVLTIISFIMSLMSQLGITI